MCPGYNTNRKFYGIHQLLIVLFMFPWLKEAFNYEIKNSIESTNRLNINQTLVPINSSSLNSIKLAAVQNSPLEIALKNAQSPELQLIKIKRFYSNENKFKLNSTLFKHNLNTIIRTQDSISNGAKYLNETELPTNEDCLEWCLQNKFCNAAIYELKESGSCYLFDCGTTGDFKCKFTKHLHYTSSILEINRQSLENKNLYEQHENDLVSLRTNLPINLTLSNRSNNNKPQTNLTTKQTVKVEDNKLSAPKCQQYQFQCKSNEECIAIYNICDKIPQCPDASDEAPELCPDSPNQVGQLSSTNSQSNKIYDKELNEKKLLPPANQVVTTNFNYKKLPEIIKLDKAANSNNFPVNNQKNIPNGNLIKPWPSILNVDSNGYPISNWNDYWGNNYNNAYIAGALNNMNNQNMMGNQNRPQTNINQNTNQNLNQNANQNANPNPNPNGKDINSLIWQMMDPNQQQQKTIFDALTNNMQQQQFLQNLFNNKQQFNNWLDNSNKNSAALSYLNYLNSKQQQSNGQLVHNGQIDKQINPTQANNLNENNNPINGNPINTLNKITDEEKQVTTETSTSTVPMVANIQASNLNKVRSVSYDFKQPFIQYSGKDDYYLDDNEQDNNSAVIALVLGLFITVLLIVIVGYRMRSIKKRIQRRGGRTSLSYDADYLVNGMYL